MSRLDNYYFDAGDLGELELTIDYDYQPAERATYNDPGCGSEITINNVWCQNRDVNWLLLSLLQDSEALKWTIDELETTDRRADAADHYNDMKKEEALHG